MKYFQMGIFVIPGACLIRKYGSQTTAFVSVFQCFSGYREAVKKSQRKSRTRHREERRRYQRSGRYSKNSISHSELDFSSISTDSGTEMASPVPIMNRARSLEVHSNPAFLRSRSPSLRDVDKMQRFPLPFFLPYSSF